MKWQDYFENIDNKSICLAAAILAVLIAAPLLVYLPGVKGPFLLDDFYNLSKLRFITDSGGLGGLYHYLTTSTAGPLGRPISLLSFLLNDITWPSQPDGFKLTNIQLHTLCGISAFWLLLLIGKALRFGTRSALVLAGLTALIWSIHPINVGTTLYVVQRMTILMTLFGLWALICFVYAYSLTKSRLKAHSLIVFGFAGCTLLSILSKENGALIPLYALLIGRLIFESGHSSMDCCRRYYQVLLLAPLLLLIYFVVQWPSLIAGYETRDFNLTERLLTQTRLLCDYLVSIISPNQAKATLYHDDYTVSQNLLQPLTTLYSLIFIAILTGLTAYLIYRRKMVVIALGFAWFLIGHLLESSFLPLELAYEHRNYMPSLGIIFIVVYGLWKLTQNLHSIPLRYGLGILCLAVIGLTALLTYQHTQNWSDRGVLIYTWAYRQPDSVRAQLEFADLVATQGQPFEAIEILEEIGHTFPRELTIQARKAAMQCQYTGRAATAAWNFDQHFSIDTAVLLGSLERYVVQAAISSCPQIDTESVRILFNTVKAHPRISANRRMMAKILYLEGNYEANQKNYKKSMHLLDKANELQKTVDIPLRQAVILQQAGMYDRALAYIEKAYTIDTIKETDRPSRREEISRLKKIVLQEKKKND